MASTARDFYEILGVGRGADEAELKKAFRRRARELHPDVNKSPDAEAQFKELARAYETLSNAETRAAYDRFGEEGLRGRAAPNVDFSSFQDLFDAFFGGDVFGGGRGRSRRGGEDIGLAVRIEFTESALGVSRELDYEAMGPCGTCEGTGAAPGAEIASCARCGGEGQVRQVTRGPFGQFVRAQLCPQCQGAGQVPEEACPDCRGRGVRPERRQRTVEIPAGIAHGQQIRITGEGHAGETGAPAGDLYVQVAVSEDARFERDGLDIVTRIAVPVTDAMTGATIVVPTVAGDTEMELRPGTQPNDELLLRGKGFPAIGARGRGDQRVVVEVKVPRVMTEEGRAAVARLGEQLTEKSYREDEGFFDRIKSAFR